MKYYCGIDIGASTAKLVIIDPVGKIVGKSLQRSGIDYAKSAEDLLSSVCARESIDRALIIRSLATGYGRDNVPWASGKMTEIACHGKGGGKGHADLVDAAVTAQKTVHRGVLMAPCSGRALPSGDFQRTSRRRMPCRRSSVRWKWRISPWLSRKACPSTVIRMSSQLGRLTSAVKLTGMLSNTP